MRRFWMPSLFFGLFAVLAFNVLSMPGRADIDAPAYNDTVRHYLDRSLEETGATNVVTAVLSDYRAFDTLGETVVLFTSIAAALSVLRPERDKDGETPRNG